MAKYVDGFVLVVPKNKAEEYKKMAEGGRDSWMKHGALAYYECSGNDLKAAEMDDEKSKAFPDVMEAGSDENVWFSFIVFNSKEHRDEVNAKVMEELGQQMAELKDFQMPIDMKRMMYGGFQVEVEG
jgi:uncharacterized protein YbaA (DUF1428 family)